MKDLINQAIEFKKTLDIPRLQQEGILRNEYKNYDWGVEYPPIHNVKPVKHIGFSKIPQDLEMSLYIHLPFCYNTCIFCSQKKLIPFGKVIDDYLLALKKETRIALKNYGWLKDKKIIALYFGGGTPTILNTKQMSSLIKNIKNSFNFSENFEFACETTPEALSGIRGTKILNLLRKEGVNRLSIGVQSFSNLILKNLKRTHDVQIFYKIVDKARKIGFDNINLDMIYGLPYQTLEEWEHSLKIIENLSPEGISPTRLKFTNPLMRRDYIKNPKIFPNEETVTIMKIMYAFKFLKSGYKFHSCAWFEKHKNHSRYYKYRFTGLPYISFGASAKSFVNDCLYSNFCDVPKYIQTANKKLPIEKYCELSKTQLMERKFLLSFYLEHGLDKEDFKNLFKEDADKIFNHFIKRLISLNLIENSPKNIKLTLKGKIFKDHITQQFYAPYIPKLEILKQKLLNKLSINTTKI